MDKRFFLPEKPITDNIKYERNSSAFIDTRSNIWLFFARADTFRSREDGDVDNESYMIYFKKSRDGKSWDFPTPINKTRPANFNQRDISAMQDSSGKIWVFASSGDSGSSRPLIKYSTQNDGISWTDAASITIPGLATDAGPLGGSRLGHSHVIFANGKFHAVVQSAGGSAIYYSNSTDTVTWTAAVAVYASGHYVPKIWVDSDGTIFVVTVKTTGEVWLSKSANNGASWSGSKILGTGASYGDWDPYIARTSTGLLIVAWAPNVGSNGQKISLSTSGDNGVTWSQAIDMTLGVSGSEEWWDYWPQILPSSFGTMLFFTSERARFSPVLNGGNIWVFGPVLDPVSAPTRLYDSGRRVVGNMIYDGFV